MFVRPLTAALVLAAGFGFAGHAAQAGQGGWADGIGTSAFGIAASFVSDGSATSLPPMPIAFGGGGRWSDQGQTRGTLNETLGIAGAGQAIATLQVTAGHLHVHTASNRKRSESVEPSADGSIDSLQITLQPYPAPATSTPPLLSIVASGVSWQASLTRTPPQSPVVAGSASFTSLTITGSLVNNSTLTATGTVPANDTVTLPIGGGYVRVTLDQQVTAGLLTCTSTCTFAASGITTDALAIHLDQVSVSGHALTGDITVGEAAAQVGK